MKRGKGRRKWKGKDVSGEGEAGKVPDSPNISFSSVIGNGAKYLI